MSEANQFNLPRDWNVPHRYRDPAVEIIDRKFGQYVLGSSALERLYTGARWTEGPVWFGDGGYFLCSDIPNDRILRWGRADARNYSLSNPSKQQQRSYSGPSRSIGFVRAWFTSSYANRARWEDHRTHGFV